MSNFFIRFISLCFISSCLLNAQEITRTDAKDIDLKPFERKFFSQNGEDGVLLKIFDVIGTTSKFFVEFGVENGTECNTRYLRAYCGWQGLMMDAGYYDPEINLQKEWITAENVNELFLKYRVPIEFDLLSVDIDFNDFYVLKSVLKKYSPRVIVAEYNATHLPTEDKVIIYNPNQFWDRTTYYGASILALYKLARKFNYSLVYAENRGVNLFFIRDDLLRNTNVTFKDTNNVIAIYKPPRDQWGVDGVHVVDPFNRPYVAAEELLKE